MTTSQNRIETDWAARGFSCELWTDPPGQTWEDFSHATDEVVIVLTAPAARPPTTPSAHQAASERLLPESLSCAAAASAFLYSTHSPSLFSGSFLEPKIRESTVRETVTISSFLQRL